MTIDQFIEKLSKLDTKWELEKGFSNIKTTN